MPDEEPRVETVVEETPVVDAPQPEAPEAEPHPLEPGGKRFKEVIAQKNAAEQQVVEMRERVARLEGAEQARRPTPQNPPQQQVFTPAQLQALVDQGQITPALMADQLAYQRQKEGEERMMQRLKFERIATTAMSEVQQYIQKMPALSNTSSAEFQKVAAAAQEIAEELQLNIQDPRVQRRALRETFGTLDRLAQAGQAREFDRAHADTHSASGGGGGAQPKKDKDPLAGVSKQQIDHWKRLNYSQKQMEAEAPFVKRRT